MSIFIPLIIYFIVFPLGMYAYFRRKSEAGAKVRKPAASQPRKVAIRPVPVEVRKSGD